MQNPKSFITPFFLLFLLSALVINAQSSVTFIIDQLPENHPENDPIYIAGDFNSWDPGNANYELNFESKYYITMEGSGDLAFKFTRGNWDKVEGGQNGEEIGNRNYSYTSNQDTVMITIKSWKDRAGTSGGGGNSTKAENVQIIDNFFMPQLNRSRRLWVYLPPNYDQETTSYPVIYMHDGQNVFDNSTAFSGEWGVDETLNELYEEEGFEAIVVAIDNGGSRRIDEYSVWENPSYGGGEGDDYSRFLVKTLKPYIDESYRTKPEREHTAIIGSSLGGLISYYAGLKYNTVFGKIGAPSPAFWFNPEIFDFTDTVQMSSSRIYLAAGGSETTTTKNNMSLIYDQLLEREVSEDNLYMEVHPGYGHNEAYWRSIFKGMIVWLFPEEESMIALGITQKPIWKMKYNSLHISEDQNEVYSASVYDFSGQLLLRDSISANRPLGLNSLPQGMVIIRLSNAQYEESIKVWIKR